MCPGDSARRAGWQASPGGRTPAFGPRRAALGTRTLACCPWHTAPGARTLACCPRRADPGVRTRFASCAHAAVALPERRMPGNLREGSYWSTNANGAGWPPCSSSLRAGLCKGLLSWQDVAEMCSRAFSHGNMLPWCVSKRSAMAIYRLDAFSSVQLWQ